MVHHTTTEPKIFQINGYPLEMIRVEGGHFLMGDDESNYDDEKPAHKVKVPSFYISPFLTTQALWKAVMGQDDNPSRFQGDQRPVERVSWEDICSYAGFLEKLNALPNIAKRNQRDGIQFRLPTEAQWEYAARGGQEGLKFPYTYSGSNQLKEVGWYDLNRHSETKPVGLKAPNYLGLYDMSGNVGEWCADVWHENYKGAPEDSSVWMEGGDQNLRVVRGGSWYWYYEYNCRVAYRGRYNTGYRYLNIGFRLARY